jgi:hypothetical protein
MEGRYGDLKLCAAYEEIHLYGTFRREGGELTKFMLKIEEIFVALPYVKV